jgi:hypothetical protein
VILRALGERLDGPIARSIWGKSILARYVPTSALMVVGRVVLAERAGVSKRTCLASIAYELGLSLSAALIMGSYFVITLPDFAHQPARFGVLVIIPIVLTALHPRVFGPAGSWALRKLGREPLPATLPFATVLMLIVPYIASYAAIGLGVFAFAEALQPLSVSDLPFVSSSYAVAFCVAVVTFIVPSGIGTRDATLALALDRVLPGAVATAIAVAFRIFQTIIEVLFVGIVVLLGRRYAKGVRARPAQPSSA